MVFFLLKFKINLFSNFSILISHYFLFNILLIHIKYLLFFNGDIRYHDNFLQNILCKVKIHVFRKIPNFLFKYFYKFSTYYVIMNI